MQAHNSDGKNGRILGKKYRNTSPLDSSASQFFGRGRRPLSRSLDESIRDRFLTSFDLQHSVTNFYFDSIQEDAE